MSEYITEWVSHNIEDPFVREEIVRCRDCRHYYVKFNSCDEFGDRWHDEYANVEPDGFCAWGARKVDE